MFGWKSKKTKEREERERQARIALARQRTQAEIEARRAEADRNRQETYQLQANFASAEAEALKERLAARRAIMADMERGSRGEPQRCPICHGRGTTDKIAYAAKPCSRCSGVGWI